MSWYVAASLQTLLAQIDTAYPRRSTISDGSIGNAAHAARLSDHNPTAAGQVCARDFTHDPAHGFDSYAAADRLLAAQDRRMKYVISHGRIGSGPRGPRPGVWRPYTGPNRHDHHVHVSVVAGPVGDDPRPWRGVVTDAPPTPAPAAPRQAPEPAPDGARVLRITDPHMAGGDVLAWQGELWRIGVGVGDHDGYFGQATEDGTLLLQRAAGITATGAVGPQARATAARVATYPKPAGPDLPLARPGGSPDVIRAFQQRLHDRHWKGSGPDGYVAVDGAMKAGGETQTQLAGFQAEKGLADTTGLGGPETWIALWTR